MLATNVAETGITIQDIVYVIDSGKVEYSGLSCLSNDDDNDDDDDTDDDTDDDHDDDDTDDDNDHKNDSYTAAGAAPGASIII